MATHYRPLSGKRHIRLLMLEDDAIRPRNGLRCKFEERDLDRILPWDSYNALSYVWGSSPERIEISCNDHLAHITTNLYQALIQIWTMTPHTRLWADALCINQSDDAEKGQQVAMMGDIYRQAGAVVIWFGTADQRIPRLWDSILANEQHERRFNERHDEQQDGQHADADIDHFLRNEWFFRAWTLQEVLLAPKAVALCGPRWIDWNVLTTGVPPKGPLGQLRICTQIMQQSTQSRVVPSPLTSMMLATLSRDAKDPRDKIYALLGLLPKDGLGMFPSYEITLLELRRRAFIANYNRYGDLICLHGCGSGWRRGAASDGGTSPDMKTLQPSWPLGLADSSKFEQVQQRKVFPAISMFELLYQASEAPNGALNLAGVPVGYLDLSDHPEAAMCRLAMLPECVPSNHSSSNDAEISWLWFEVSAPTIRSIALDTNLWMAQNSRISPAADMYRFIELRNHRRCACPPDGLTGRLPADPRADIILPRKCFLPEARNGDIVCVMSGDGCFLLRHENSGFFSVEGSAFRSSLSWADLENKLEWWMLSKHMSGDQIDQNHRRHYLYAPSIFWFDLM